MLNNPGHVQTEEEEEEETTAVYYNGSPIWAAMIRLIIIQIFYSPRNVSIKNRDRRSTMKHTYKLCNRAGHYIFALCFLPSSSYGTETVQVTPLGRILASSP